MSNVFFILASASPRRRELIGLLGAPCQVVRPGQLLSERSTIPEVDETPLPHETPEALVHRLSRLKAEAVLAHYPGLLNPAGPAGSDPDQPPVVIAADTVVALGSAILGKPGDPAEAKAMLTALRQAQHQVYTGFAIGLPPASLSALALPPPPAAGPLIISRVHRSDVHMRPYSEAEIEAYVAGGDPFDKAGAYSIQHEQFAPVAELSGCYAGVMGLPLAALAQALQELNISLAPVGPSCQRFTGQPCCQL